MDNKELKQVLIDQQAEFKEISATTGFRLEADRLVNLVANSKLAKVILGVRRSGKSTLCQQVLQQFEVGYVNFDDERLIGVEAAHLQSIMVILHELKPAATHFYFDEIQNITGWELFINRLQRAKKNILITGSNGKLLGTDLTTHLTGRQISITLSPLTFREFLRWRQHEPIKAEFLSTTEKAELSRLFSEYCDCGGFPEVVLGEAGGIYLRELFDKIISRDIVQRYKLRDVRVLKEIASYLIQNSSQSISFKKLQESFQLASIVTARKYVQHLLDVFLVHELRAYSYKLKERSTAKRKVYACDLGMMRALWTKPTADLGAKLETVTYLNLLASNNNINHDIENNLYYLNESNREIDFCLLEAGKPHTLIQSCYDLSDRKTREREVRALIDLGLKYQAKRLLIITREHEEIIEVDNLKIEVIPAYLFFS